MGQLTYWKFLKDQFTILPDVSTFEKNLTDKTVILTGATSGVGFEIAKHLVRVNPKKIILGCRDLKKGNEVLEILKSLGYNHAEAWLLDLGDFKTITSFVNRFEKEENKLDLLIQCAGTWFGKYEKTVDGWEMNASDSDQQNSNEGDITPRIVIVGSESHHYVHNLPEAEEVNILTKLNDEGYCISEGENIGRRYFVAKAFLLFFTRQLSTYLSTILTENDDPNPQTKTQTKPPITTTCTTPGFTRTAIFNASTGKHPMQRGISFKISERLLARSPENGSRPIMWSVFSPHNVVHGRWCSNCRVEEESDFAISEVGWVVQKRIWREALDVLARVDCRVKQIEEEYLMNA